MLLRRIRGIVSAACLALLLVSLPTVQGCAPVPQPGDGTAAAQRTATPRPGTTVVALEFIESSSNNRHFLLYP